MKNIGVSKAIDHLGLLPLAAALGVTYQAVRKWQRQRPPAERCHAIVEICGGAVSLADLRPDLWPPLPAHVVFPSEQAA